MLKPNQDRLGAMRGSANNQMTKSILFPVALEGQFYQISAMRDEFRVPIVIITMTQQIEDRLLQSNLTQPDRLYSLPKFFRQERSNVSGKEIRCLQNDIQEYETRFQIDSSFTMYYSDRFFRLLTSRRAVLERMVIYYRFIDWVLSNENILALKANMTTFFGLALNSAVQVSGAPAIKYQTGRVNGRVEFIDGVEWGVLCGWKDAYPKYLSGQLEECSDRAAKAEADAWLEEFRRKPERPAYAKRNSVIKFDGARLAKHITRAAVARLTPGYWRSLSRYSIDRKMCTQAPLGHAFLKDVVYRELRAAIVRRLAFFNRSVDLENRYIYFPLQYVPEITTLTYAVPNDDQLAVIKALSKSIPGDMMIYVKEHTSMIGRRPMAFYRELNSIVNVELVSPRLDTFRLIDESIAVATLNGTPGWEAFLRGKPVLAFGRALYSEFPNILQLDIGRDMSTTIREYLRKFVADEQMISAAIAAYFEVTAPATSGDVGTDTEEEDALENARILVSYFRRQVERSQAG